MRTSLVFAVAMLAGCSEWPRGSNWPDDPSNPVDGTTDAESLFQVDPWADLGTEDDVHNSNSTLPDDAESLQAPAAGGLDSGAYWRGTISQWGWSVTLPRRNIAEGTTCGTTEATRVPDGADVDDGDYTGDVDAFLFTPSEAGQLCGRVLLAPPNPDVNVTDAVIDEFGYDVIVFEVDECGVPTGTLAVGEPPETVGFGLGGQESFVGVEVEANQRYAVQIGGYAARDGFEEIPWDYVFAVSLVHPTLSPTPNGGPLCPAIPAGVTP